MSLQEYFANWIPAVEAEMQRVVNDTLALPAPPDAFSTMLRYHLGFANADGTPAHINAGKRIRPMLVLLSCEACGGDPQVALPAAAAVELLHNFSLIHDDIEDGDELRRGRPTLWKEWGVPHAINMGDAMYAHAHLALQSLSTERVLPGNILQAWHVFECMCLHLTMGQHMDIGFESRSDVTAANYMQMIEGKTAALIQACCEIGAIIAGATPKQIAALGEFGRNLGLSFQLQDDVLGIWGDPTITGKRDGDLVNRKKTLPVLFAADHDPVLRARYFGADRLTADDVQWLKQRINDLGGRAYTEQAASAAYGHAMESHSAAMLNNAAATALHDLAHSLLSRTA